MGSERGYVVVDDSGNVTANRQVDPVADIPLSGGGGSLPSWWTVDSSPSAESVSFLGAALGGGAIVTQGGLQVWSESNDGLAALEVYNESPNGTKPTARFQGTDGDAVLLIGPSGAVTISPGASQTLKVDEDEIGFFGAAPAARPTGVAVDAAGIHAALVTLGLITA